MTRLNDADALNKKLCETTIFIKDGEMFQRMINDAPTIEPDGDTISRSRAIKDISEWATDILHPDRLIKEDAIHILESLPSADAVEVVRCKDCIVSETFQRDSNGTTERYCKAFTHLRNVADDDYCSFGERREP